jgi:hypothetical protein
VNGNRSEMQSIICKVLMAAASTQRFLELLKEPSLICSLAEKTLDFAAIEALFSL